MKRLLIAVFLFLPVFASAETTLTCPNLTRPLVVGMRDISSGGEVGRLQLFLADYYGLSHADIVTGYFGQVTRATVRRFQCEKLAICSGSEYESGYGFVGRLTRTAIQNSCGTQTADPTTNTDPPTTTEGFPSCTLSVPSSTVTAGESVRLTWRSKNTVRGTISPSVGSIEREPNGSVSVTVSATTTFTGRFYNAAGESDTCTVIVRVRSATSTQGSCAFNGLTVASSTAVTAYESQTVAAGGTCRSQTRMCGNGTLSGTYQYSACTVGTDTTTTSTTSGFPYSNVQPYGYPGLQGVAWLNLKVTPPSPYTDASYDVTRTLLLAQQSLTVDFGDGTSRLFNYNEGDGLMPLAADGQIWIQMTHRYARAGTYTVKWYYLGSFLAQGTYTQP